MWTTHLLVGLIGTIFLTPVGSAWAGLLQITSPDTAQTYAYGHLKASRFYWNDKEKALCADLTFSNEFHVSAGDSCRSEYFLFKFPGVTLDAKTGVFYATDKSGTKIPVAVKRTGLLSRIEPSPATCVQVYKEHGEVQVVLTAVPRGQVARHWVEEEGSLQSLALYRALYRSDD